MITARDATNAYVLLLGRPTEPGWTAEGWLEQGPETVAANLLRSPEFRERIARPVLAGRMPSARYGEALPDDIRIWASTFFEMSSAGRDRVAAAQDWPGILAALLADPEFTDAVGPCRDWAWPQLARRFAILDGNRDPKLAAEDVIERKVENLRLIGSGGLAPGAAGMLKVINEDPHLLFDIAPDLVDRAAGGLTVTIDYDAERVGAFADVLYSDGRAAVRVALHDELSTFTVDDPEHVRVIAWRPYAAVGLTIGFRRLSATIATIDHAASGDDWSRVSSSSPRVVAHIKDLIARDSPLLNAKWLARFGCSPADGADLLFERGFDPQFQGSPYFDRDWYIEQKPSLRGADYFTVMSDYLAYGQFVGRSPNPFFIGDRYMEAHPDVGRAIRNGLVGSVLEDLVRHDGNNDLTLAIGFDQDFYRTAPQPLSLDGVDPGNFGVGPFGHYVLIGWREGRRPNRVFDEEWFEAHVPALDAPDLPYPNAFSRYLHVAGEADAYVSPFFDPVSYLYYNPDIGHRAETEAGFDPLAHFLTSGRAEGRRADEGGLSSTICRFFPREFPDSRSIVGRSNGRDALLSAPSDQPDHEAIAETVWRYGEPFRSVMHGGEIIAFAGQRMTFHISGIAAIPDGRLADVRLTNAPTIVDRGHITFPTLENVVALSALGGSVIRDGGYCAWFTIDLDPDMNGRFDLPVTFVFERNGLRRTASGPRLVLKVAPAPERSTQQESVQVLMASYNPEENALHHQVQTIADQQAPSTGISLLISDDASGRQGAEIVRAAAARDGVSVSLSRTNLGFIGNFQRALLARSPFAHTLLFADQDDSWYPGKVARLTKALRDGASCAFSDMRIVDGRGGVISPTFWDTRRAHWHDPVSLSVANAVTGAAAAFTAELADILAPFPAYVGLYHDQWLAVLAAAKGPVAYIEEPLYDYIQHADNVLGFGGSRGSHAAKWRPIRNRLRHALRHRDTEHWSEKDVGALRAADQAIPELLQRYVLLKDALARVEYWHQPAVQRLAEAFCQMVAGEPVDIPFVIRTWRRLKQKSGGDAALIGIDYRMEAVLIALHALRTRFGLHARVASSLERTTSAYTALERRLADPGVTNYAKKIAPIPATVEPTGGTHPIRINIFLPELNPKTFFGGYHSKMSLVSRLIERGYPVRIILVDQPIPDPLAIADIGEAFPELTGGLDAADIVGAGARDRPLLFDERDALLATTWWSAHIVNSIRQSLCQPRFTYLVQEYEPFTFSLGTWFCGAQETYALPHAGLYSTEILRQYFVAQGEGQFAPGADPATPFLTFDNPIVGVDRIRRVAAEERGRRLVFYARPQPHAARNMYEFGVESLRMATEMLGDDLAGWDIVGVGADSAGEVDLGGGRTLKMIRKLDADSYRRVLAASDVGVALMYTPHPSLVPIEMAAAGLMTVTNACMTKTAATMASISPDILVARPDVASIADAIVTAVRRVKATGYMPKPVHWPTSPAEAFPDGWIDALIEMMRGSLSPGAPRHTPIVPGPKSIIDRLFVR